MRFRARGGDYKYIYIFFMYFEYSPGKSTRGEEMARKQRVPSSVRAQPMSFHTHTHTRIFEKNHFAACVCRFRYENLLKPAAHSRTRAAAGKAHS